MASKFSSVQIAEFRDLDLMRLLGVMADKSMLTFKIDPDFHPVKDKSTVRVIVVMFSGFSHELLITKQKWFDLRNSTGGGGAIDLYCHLTDLTVRQALKFFASLFH